jgi:hypothetical protein
MATKCEACGTEIHNETANKSVLNIAESFKAIEAELKESGLAGQALDAEIKSRRARAIRDFPVPNGRADLLSLLHYIAPRLDGANADPNIDDWRTKFSEVANLAKKSFKSDPAAREEVEEIQRSTQVSMSGELKNRAKRSPIIAILVGIVILVVSGGLISAQLQKRALAACEEEFDDEAISETARLEEIAKKTTNELKASRFADALATSSRLRWKLINNCRAENAQTMTAQWDSKRNELMSLIRSEEDKQARARKTQEKRLADVERAVEAKAAVKEAAVASKAASVARNATTNREF